MTKSTPLTLICLLGGGVLLFGLNAYLPVPVETWFAFAGMICFAAGMLFSLFGFFRAVVALASRGSRQSIGVTIPILTIVVAVGAWAPAVYTAVVAKKSLDQREQYEKDHWDELHGTNQGTSQPPPGN